MAVLLPTLQRVRKQAKTVGCQANLRQVGLIFAAYVAENNGRFAPGTDKASVQRFGYSGFMPMLIGVSSGHKDLLRCPMAYQPKGMPDLAKAEAESSQCAGRIGDTSSPWVWAYREAQGSWHVYVGSYGFNICTRNIGGSGWGGGAAQYATTDVRVAPDVPAYLDCMILEIAPALYHAEPPPYEGCHDRPYCSFSPMVMNRHDGGINCLFMDWSVRKVGLKELWTLKWANGWDTANRWTRAGGVQPADWPGWMRGFRDY